MHYIKTVLPIYKRQAKILQVKDIAKFLMKIYPDGIPWVEEPGRLQSAGS